MANNDVNNDDLFKLIAESSLKMPFNGFEDTVMHKIEQAAKQKNKYSLNVKLSILFSVLASLLGILLLGLLPKTGFHFPDLTAGSTILLIQATFVFLFLLQLEKYIRQFIAPKR
ncbi:hypothetical protein A4H97_08360 [Niastella yeongjuensis]|uniref:Uncharacterized protein n=1 Tax=Niastella yeongjuensis TaxID=354355 RepID=A0A1V9EMV6_9BACT|nr:hypothetical protein [Niastella yeongjuensis]OQP47493.1 hypothetical protein A4H97_08360 [Niastella yeongjuensis]SEN86697.1 hypothetical protein SAMN05660816_01699 [Niastella yeongjuensis]